MKILTVSLIIGVFSVLAELTETNGFDIHDCNRYGNCSAKCKEHVTGSNCDQCKTGTFHLSSENALGCTKCVCMGVSPSCDSSRLYRSQIHSTASSIADIRLITPYRSGVQIIASGYTPDTAGKKTYCKFPNGQTKTHYYWLLPSAFLGNRLTSYGGFLTYNLHYTSPKQDMHFSVPDVALISPNREPIYHYLKQPSGPNVIGAYIIPLVESSWKIQHASISREQFLKTLANVTAIRIRATYSEYTKCASISDVSMDTATEVNTGGKRALEVEKCNCPNGFIGLSCEKCGYGYTRNNGCQFGSCERCKCNGHSQECDPETGVCQNCAQDTTGDHCDLCKPGYEGDPTSDGCFPEMIEDCDCNADGSKRYGCVERHCECKDNVEGANCDRCRPSTFGLSRDNEDGCIECFCSGVTNQCHQSSLNFRPIVPNFHNDTHIFTVVDVDTELCVTVVGIKVGLFRDGTMSLEYDPQRPKIQLMWALSNIFTGNKVKSYGGYLKFSQKFTASVPPRSDISLQIILIGNGLKISRSVLMKPQNDTFQATSVPLTESEWYNDLKYSVRLTRTDFMKVLSNLTAIFIHTPYFGGMNTVSIRGVSMDTAEENSSGGDRATKVEECNCPPGYTGTSCESCSRGYYRDVNDVSRSFFGGCKPCPCNNHEESCERLANSRIQCHCTSEYSGEYCQEPKNRPRPKLVMSVEPPGQTIPQGTVAQMDCIVSDPDPNIEIVWLKNGEEYFHQRAQKTGRILKIVDAQVSDTDGYSCLAKKVGSNSWLGRADAQLIVLPSAVPVLEVYPPGPLTVTSGQRTTLMCRTSTKYPNLKVHWAREDGRAFAPNVVPSADGSLTINNIAILNEGIYKCTSANEVGPVPVTVKINVVSLPVIRITPNYNNNGTIFVKSGERVKLICEADGHPKPNVTLAKFSPRSGTWAIIAPVSENSAVYEIKSMSKVDVEGYACTAGNSAGFDKKYFRIEMEYQSTADAFNNFEIDEESLTIPVGKKVDMNCKIPNHPKIQVQWNKSGFSQLPNTATTNRKGIVDILTISEVAKMDAGDYTCEAFNTDDRSTKLYKKTFHLKVISPPTITLTPELREVKPGGTVTIACSATGDQPITIEWLAVGRSLRPNEVNHNGVLTFNGVTGADVGKYTCKATNKAGSVISSAEVLSKTCS